MLQCVAALQGVAGCQRMLQCGCMTRVDAAGFCMEQCVAVRCSAVQLCVAVCCSACIEIFPMDQFSWSIGVCAVCCSAL